MPGDPASRNDDELLSQIDELKARMDRLMSGGTSTSNSALLTDDLKSKSKAGTQELVDRPADPAPNRTRVRDLIGPEDVEVVEPYPAPKDGVSFPDDRTDEPIAEVEPPEPEPPEPEPPPFPQTRPTRSAPIGGSVIKVEEDAQEPRPHVATFDDLGSAIQDELDKDSSVPPADVKKGPDLASRFGPAAGKTPAVVGVPPEETALVGVTDEDDDLVEEVELETDDLANEESRRGSSGMVAAIWIVTAIASGAIATLHFAGII